MKKCKDKILEQRNILKAEEEEIEKEYQMMANLSTQFKKLFSTADSAIKSSSNLA